MDSITTKCEVCEQDFTGDMYKFTCPTCSHPDKLCKCGSDDTTLFWDMPFDQNGEISDTIVWCVMCNSCECRTAWFDTAKEASEAWKNGHAEKCLV